LGLILAASYILQHWYTFDSHRLLMPIVSANAAIAVPYTLIYCILQVRCNACWINRHKGAKRFKPQNQKL